MSIIGRSLQNLFERATGYFSSKNPEPYSYTDIDRLGYLQPELSSRWPFLKVTWTSHGPGGQGRGEPRQIL